MNKEIPGATKTVLSLQAIKSGYKSEVDRQQQNGAVEAWWAHNPEVRG